MEVLEVLWAIVLLIAVMKYTVLDGFDLGVGALHLCTPKDIERRMMLSAIGPVWDGNEVWLVVVIGGLWAGFPSAYAAIFSTFYIPMMFLIFGLIFRAVSIEFRSKLESMVWRTFWDWTFSIASIILILALGLIIGNLITGIPVDEKGVFKIDFFEQIHSFSLLVSITTLALFCLHGCCYLELKTQGALQAKVYQWGRVCFLFFFVSYLATSLASIVWAPDMVQRIIQRPELWIIAIVNLLIIIALGRSQLKKKAGRSFLLSSLNIMFLLLVYAFGNFPILLKANNDLDASLTIYNSSSSTYTLVILLIIACVAVPLVIGYTTHIYRVFKAKVDENSLIY